jgi:hypothetical protein
MFFPYEKAKKITWLDDPVLAGRKKMGGIEAKVEEMKSRLGQRMEEVTQREVDPAKVEFRGLTYQQWYDVFIQVFRPGMGCDVVCIGEGEGGGI